MPTEATIDKATKPKRRRWVLITLTITALIVLSAVGLLAVRFLAKPTIKVPDNITQNTRTSLYLPAKLPGNYHVDEDSFLIAEEGVVIFRATNGAGGQIAFSEQTTPKNVNFDDFYKEQVQEAKTLPNVPFPSIFGTGKQRQRLVSIVANDTWIIATSQSPLQENDFSLIAQSVYQYRP